MIRFPRLLHTSVLSLALSAVSVNCSTAQEWRPVPAGGKFNISGIALAAQEAGRDSFLVVQDSKKPDEDRIGLVTVEGDGAPEYRPLAWPAHVQLPRDLEGVTGVPGSPRTFLALDSNGRVYRLELNDNGSTPALTANFELPQAVDNPNYEGLCIQKVGDQLLAAWAHRGRDLDPAVLCWSALELTEKGATFGPVTSQTLTIPWPAVSEVRHVSDLKVDPAGVLYTSAASDPGNYGPFESGVYAAGVFTPQEDAFVFRRNEEPSRLQVSRYNKIEALELVPGPRGGLVLGSDDESVGGAIRVGW